MKLYPSKQVRSFVQMAILEGMRFQSRMSRADIPYDKQEISNQLADKFMNDLEIALEEEFKQVV